MSKQPHSITYCPHCATPMETAEVAGRRREICPACGFILYRNPVPGAGVLVEIEDSIVLVKRGQPPSVGQWALPSGYIEADESVEQAAIRECKEETGLDVELLELFGVYSFPEGATPSGIIIFYRARPVGGTLQAGDDAQEVGVFPLHNLPEPIAFRTHRQVLTRLQRIRFHELPPDLQEITIRRARLEDEAHILELLSLIPSNARMSAKERETAIRRFRESLAIEVLVAEVDRRIVGFLALSFIPVLSGLRALIDDVAVDPTCRRQGIGRALVEAAIQQASQRGATHLFVDTSRGDEVAREFYRASGFEAGGIAPLRIR